jgi:hypothetical protein
MDFRPGMAQSEPITMSWSIGVGLSVNDIALVASYSVISYEPEAQMLRAAVHHALRALLAAQELPVLVPTTPEVVMAVRQGKTG